MDIPEKKYREIVELIPTPCVDLVILYNERVLLIRRKNNPAKGELWLPGGRIIKNENFNTAVKRKLLEETGLSGKIIKQIGFEETIFDEAFVGDIKTGTHTINLIFLVEADGDSVILDEQSSEYKWIDFIDEKLHPYVKNVIKKSGVFNNEI